MATEIRLVKHIWGYGMTSNDENYIKLRQSLNVNELGGGGMLPQKILKFGSSEIVGNS